VGVPVQNYLSLSKCSAPIGGPAEGEEREAVMKPRPPRWYPRRSLWATPASRPRRTNRSSPNPPELRLLLSHKSDHTRPL